VLSWSNNTLFILKGEKHWKYWNKTFIVSKEIADGFQGIPKSTTFDGVMKWNINGKI
jgi:hypothetical protein